MGSGHKCGIMHMRKKGVVRSKMSYSIGGEDLPFVSNYKYLGSKRDAGECSMEESTGEMERRTGEETEVVNYADHHHGMWRRVAMCWNKDEEREENDS